ncbi:MAG: hydroxyacid-oxoacid transhydrogenase [Thermoprotei archaeon]|nr:hydroxyacid-oxoacid transhydrogenase [Thermoprotei archaeon]
MVFYTYVNEGVFTLASVTLKFGIGASEEAGFEVSRLGLKRVLLVTDRNLMELGVAKKVVDNIEKEGVEVEVYDDIEIEPTDVSMVKASEWARDKVFDGIVAVGGGSVIDHAKVINLLTKYPANIIEYISRPIGLGKPVPGPLKPLIAVPTTAGSGSENTGVAVLDVKAERVKTGISHYYLKPTMGIVDPLMTVTMPPTVTAATGLDVLTHAAEAYTTKPYYARPRYSSPAERPVYQGANPITDVFSEKAVELVSKYLRRAYYNGHDVEARYYMMLACELASASFGHAGVHIPHANAYPIAGMVREYVPPDYKVEHPLVPHGISVVLTAPAAFKTIAPAVPERVAKIAELLGVQPESSHPKKIGEAAYEAFASLIEDLKTVPRGLKDVGYRESDIPALVEGSLKQQRLLIHSPIPATKSLLEKVFKESMEL